MDRQMALQATTTVLLITQLVLPATGEGQGLYLRGSARSAVVAHNFKKKKITWKVETTNGTFYVNDTCLLSSKYERQKYNYDNFTCEHVLTIKNEDYYSYQGSNWTCQDNGWRSNTISLDVEVPLLEIHIENSTSTPLALTDNETLTLVCKTNPTKPSSSITWRPGNQTLKGNVTSLVRDDDDMVADVSKITFTVTCGHHLVGIQCAAVYRNKMLISGTQVLFVHCTTNQESVLSASGQCFGAGLEVGITLCLVSLVAMGATAAYIIHWKRRNAQKDVARKVAVPQVNAACMTTSEFGDGQRHKVYEPSQDTVNDGTYEPIQVYQNI